MRADWRQLVQVPKRTNGLFRYSEKRNLNGTLLGDTSRYALSALGISCVRQLTKIQKVVKSHLKNDVLLKFFKRPKNRPILIITGLGDPLKRVFLLPASFCSELN